MVNVDAFGRTEDEVMEAKITRNVEKRHEYQNTQEDTRKQAAAEKMSDLKKRESLVRQPSIVAKGIFCCFADSASDTKFRTQSR